jgi:hypothetical protein
MHSGFSDRGMDFSGDFGLTRFSLICDKYLKNSG